MLIRKRLLNAAEAAARAHVREVGPNNHGPQVKKFLAEVGLPEGYAWCDAFLSYEEHAAAGRRLPIESASVEQTYLAACKLGWIVSKPAADDLVLYDFDGDGRTDDHIGIVRSVSAFGLGYWKLNTVEGNTGDQSAADGDGVYLRTRVVKRSSVRFVRIPGVVRTPRKIQVTITGPTTTASGGTTAHVTVKPKPKPKPRPKAKKKLAPKPRYYKYKHNVHLKLGQTLAYQPGKGYYARTKKKAT